MKITSINTNGIRSAARKGFFEWIEREQPDVVCVQETKAQIHQLGDEIFCPSGYHCRYHDAEKKGYSGVAIYSRHEPDEIIDIGPADLRNALNRLSSAPAGCDVVCSSWSGRPGAVARASVCSSSFCRANATP